RLLLRTVNSKNKNPLESRIDFYDEPPLSKGKGNEQEETWTILKDEQAVSQDITETYSTLAELLSTLSQEEKIQFSDQRIKIEFAKRSAQCFGDSISEHIQNYEITSEEARVEIAKIAARYSKSLSKYIKNYEIKSEEARIEISKIAAQQDGGGTSKHIQN